MKNIFRALQTFIVFLYCDMSYSKEIMGYMNTNFMLSDLLPWILSETPSVNKNTCMIMCLSSTDCRGIMYKTSTQGCMLVSYDYMEAVSMNSYLIGSSATVAYGQEWVFYHVARDCRQADCPVSQGYTFIEEVCYCMKYHSTLMSYTDATYRCKLEGGELIKIDKAIKQEYVGYYLDHLDVAVSSRVYIQGMKNGRKWFFDDGAGLQYYNWATSQPNNGLSETILFLKLDVTGKYKWHDGAHGTYSFVCQINI